MVFSFAVGVINVLLATLLVCAAGAPHGTFNTSCHVEEFDYICENEYEGPFMVEKFVSEDVEGVEFERLCCNGTQGGRIKTRYFDFSKRVPKCVRWSLEMFEDFPANALTIYIQNHRHKKIILETGTAYRKRLDDHNARGTSYRRPLDESEEGYATAKVRELETKRTLHDVSLALRFIFEIDAAQKAGRLCLHVFSVYVGCWHPLDVDRLNHRTS